MSVANNRGWGEEEIARFESWKDAVAEIESNNIPDRKQSSGGPGRGKYQYELAKGGSGANTTAINRFKSLVGNNFAGLPKEDIAVLKSKDPDFSMLSEDTQDAIFLADKVKAPNAALNDLVSGQVTLADAWADWHWKGDEKVRPAKIKMFEKRIGSMPVQKKEPVQMESDPIEDAGVRTVNPEEEEGLLDKVMSLFRG